MDASRLERAARAAAEYVLGEMAGRLAKMGYSGGVCVESNFINSAAAHALRAALAAQPAQEPVDTLCLFCRTELDPDEMDDGSDLPPLAPGVCSECFQRWHDEPVWRKRLKEATDKPAQAGEAVAWQNVEAALREWEGRVVIRAKMEGAKEDGIAYAREQESRALMVALNAIHAYAAHPTPRAEAASAVPAWRDSFPPTHYCRECKALWRRWPDGSWSLVTAACGKCCDNVPMGEQIVALGEACTAPASAEAVAREAAEFALREFCRMEDIPLDRIQPSDISRAVAHALRAKGAK